jgi:hypothetical protein
MGVTPLRRLAACLAVVVALIGTGAAAASACDGRHDGTRSALSAFAGFRHHHHHHLLLRAAAQYLGMTPLQVRQQLASGKSLAQIANATPGKSSAGLVDALVAAVKTKLDAKVAAGELSAAKEAEFLAKVQPKLVALVNATWTHH